MRAKLYSVLNKIYGVLMSVSFFAGIIPLPGFLIALCIGGTTGEKICVFFGNGYYPWVIVLGSIAVVIGLIAMYVGKMEGLSVKKVSAEEPKT
ncbi:MAG: hypothetical protein J6J43_07315 [Oscillospiraceae bacterium]|nr:hypothetical protein [Oscillospiraceae bacterium]